MDIVRKEPHHGWIEVITGSMFSGKSEELIRRLRRAQIARQKVQIFKPLIDDRYSEDHIVSHSDMRIASQNVRNSDELVKQVASDTEVVGIDEGQFFDANLPAACNTLADRGLRVIVAEALVDGRLEDLHLLPRYLRTAQPPDQLLALAAEHAAGDDLDPAVMRCLADDFHAITRATGIRPFRC